MKIYNSIVKRLEKNNLLDGTLNITIDSGNFEARVETGTIVFTVKFADNEVMNNGRKNWRIIQKAIDVELAESVETQERDEEQREADEMAKKAVDLSMVYQFKAGQIPMSDLNVRQRAMMPKTPTVVLGLDVDDPTKDQIKKAYKKAALEAHPDKGGSEETMRAVTEAYNELIEPFKFRETLHQQHKSRKTTQTEDRYRKRRSYTKE